jgi:lipopolysaccharide export system protein LptC
MEHQVTSSAGSMVEARNRLLEETGVRRGAALRKARQHSLVVRTLRKLIPVGSIAAVVSSAMLLVGARMAEVPPLIDPARAGIEDGHITMKDPRLLGFQKDNRSYQVTADKARQAVKTPNLVELAQPLAKVETQNAVFAHIQAAAGLFDTTIEKLQLDNDIKIRTDDGYTLNLRDAQIDMKHGGLVSNKSVVLDMENGRIRASAIDLKNNGEVVNFTGGVTSEFTNLFNTTPASKTPPGSTQ